MEMDLGVGKLGLGSAMMDLKRGEGGSCRVWGFSEDGDGSESGWGNWVWGLSEDEDGSGGGEIGSGVCKDGPESGGGSYRVWGLIEDGNGSGGGEIGSGVSVRMEMDLRVGKLGQGSR